jgi:septal ring factor EnvC (AmiA/AmiB activator)
MTKPKTIKQWEKVCNVLDDALQASIKDEAKLEAKIDNLEEQIGKL